MKKTFFIVALLALAGAGVYFWTGGKEKAGAAGQNAARDRPITVKTVTAKVQPMPVIVETVGTVEPEHRAVGRNRPQDRIPPDVVSFGAGFMRWVTLC
jgi:multidrug efflux pump subunit AcrA (membrane-fusion protein)